MTPGEVIRRYCELSRRVQDNHFRFSVAADCFCDKQKMKEPSWQYQAAVIEFIEAAAAEKMMREGPMVTEE